MPLVLQFDELVGGSSTSSGFCQAHRSFTGALCCWFSGASTDLGSSRNWAGRWCVRPLPYLQDVKSSIGRQKNPPVSAGMRFLPISASACRLGQILDPVIWDWQALTRSQRCGSRGGNWELFRPSRRRQPELRLVHWFPRHQSLLAGLSCLTLQTTVVCSGIDVEGLQPCRQYELFLVVANKT